MSTNEQNTATAILNTMTKLRTELANLVKATNDKIAGLEIAYEVLTGNAVPKDVATPKTRAPRTSTEPTKYAGPSMRRTGRGGRRGMRIDRQATEKTLAFMQERNGKPTTIAMVSRKFNITKEAAAQRFRKLQSLGWANRVNPGEFVPVEASTSKETPKAKVANGQNPGPSGFIVTMNTP